MNWFEEPCENTVVNRDRANFINHLEKCINERLANGHLTLEDRFADIHIAGRKLDELNEKEKDFVLITLYLMAIS